MSHATAFLVTALPRISKRHDDVARPARISRIKRLCRRPVALNRGYGVFCSPPSCALENSSASSSSLPSPSPSPSPSSSSSLSSKSSTSASPPLSTTSSSSTPTRFSAQDLLAPSFAGGGSAAKTVSAQQLDSTSGLGVNVEHPRWPRLRLRFAPSLSMSQRLQRTATAVAVLYLLAVALLLLRAAAAPAWRPLFSVQDRLLCFALAIIAPELGLVTYDNFRSCAIVVKRAERRQSRAFETLASSVRLHGLLTAAIAAAQLAGLYTSAIMYAAPGALLLLLVTVLFFCIRRVRFERAGRVYRVYPSEYLDVIVACGASFFVVLAMYLGIFPCGLSAVAVLLAMLYWVCKFMFVPT